MRVMFWSSVYWPHIGGVQVLARHLLPALAARGHDLVVVADQDPPDLAAQEDQDGIRVLRFPLTLGLRDIDRLAGIRRDLADLRRSFAPDLCHTVALGATDFYERITQDPEHPTPTLVSLFGHWPSQYSRLLCGTLERADWIACDSAQTLEYSYAVAPGAAAPRSVIRNAVGVPTVAPAPLPDAPRLLVAGRLSREKGVDLALRAFALVLRRCPSARLTVAGDGPERLALEQLAAALGVGEAVEFLGWTAPDEVPRLLNAASVLVLPSRADSFPLIGLEAALMERPVVAAAVGGLPEMIVHEGTGILVNAEDPEALAIAVVRLIEDPAWSVRLGRAARQRVQERHRFSDVVDAYDELYERVAHRSTGRP